MARVVGQDGLYLEMGSEQGAAADRVVWSQQEASVVWEDLEVIGLGGPFSAKSVLDVGSDGNQAAIAIQGSWSEFQARIGGWRLGEPAGELQELDGGWDSALSDSMGTLGLRTEGSVLLGNIGGLLDETAGEALFDLNSEGALFYRQGGEGAPELSFQNFSLGARFTDGQGGPGTGSLGLDQDGLVMVADYMDLDLFFDLHYAGNPTPDTTGFDAEGADPMLLFGWEGGIENAQLRLGGGGLDGTEGGLKFTPRWDYSDNFAWRLGQSSGARDVELRFSDWQRMGGNDSEAEADFRLPIVLDTVTQQNHPGGVRFGSDSASLGPTPIGGDAALGLVSRDGRLHAYNTRVEVIDGADVDDFRWSLLYTFGQLDSNIFLAPELRDGAPGVRANVDLAISSPGYWEEALTGAPSGSGPAESWATNTHFLIADTEPEASDAPFGIGIVNADLLWQVRDLYLRVTGDDDIDFMPGGFALETDEQARYRFRGILGGGELDDLGNPVRIALLDVNLETDRFVFVLGPAPDPVDEYVSFDGLLDFNGQAYLSLAEPSRPEANFALTDVEGRLRWADGRVELESSATTDDGKPRLTISNQLLFGNTAGGEPLIGNVRFGGDNLGRIVVPGGQWHSTISLKPQ